MESNPDFPSICKWALGKLMNKYYAFFTHKTWTINMKTKVSCED